MSYSRPTLPTIIDRIEKDFEVKFNKTSRFLRRSLFKITSQVFGGVSHSLYGFIDYVASELLPDRSQENLARQASLYWMTKKAASFSSGPVEIDGTVGLSIPSGSTLRRGDGWIYALKADATIGSGGSVTATAEALNDGTGDYAGAEGNCESGVELSFVAPIAGVNSTCVVGSAGLTGGFDEETIEELRKRLLYRKGNPPQGGSDADYVKWALEVPGVTRAWSYERRYGYGTVGVAFVCDGNGEGAAMIPDEGMVATVAAYIAKKRPLGARVTVFAPRANPIPFTIRLNPDTPAVRAAVELELKALFRRAGQPAVTIKTSNIDEAISVAAGEADHLLVAPPEDITNEADQIPILGAMTWL